MHGNRILMVLCACLLAAATVCADDLGYVDCTKHGEETQVFGKPRRSQDAVASLPCGERFTVLLYGFIFSRIETKDGKVGYIYSNLITVDHSRTAAVHAQPEPAAAPSVSPAPPATASVPAQTNPVPAETAASKAIADSSEAKANAAEATPSSPQKKEPAGAPAPSPSPEPAQAYSDPTPVSPSEAAARRAQPAETTANPTPVTERQPVAAEPASPAIQPSIQPSIQPAIQPANARESWERPNPTAAQRTPRVEFYGGYAFTRFDAGGSGSNLNGGMGAFGWNAKPWLQIVGDTSYNVVTLSGVKNVLYGNHYGPRVYPRGRNRLGMSPFVEALFGGSRLSTSVSGTNAYNTSENAFSIKTGGGLDVRVSRYFKVRLMEADYYRTSFGGTTQNNYWISTGIVLRLFGGGSE